LYKVEKSKRQSEDSGDIVGALPEKDSGNDLITCYHNINYLYLFVQEFKKNYKCNLYMNIVFFFILITILLYADRTSLSSSSFHFKADDSFKSERGDTSTIDEM